MKRRGFTLIELLIVVAIIAILAAIAVPNFLEAQTRAKVSRAMGDIRSMVIALEFYRVDNIDYPNGQMVTGDPPDRTFNILLPSKYCLTTPIPYISSLPTENPFGTFSLGHFDTVKKRHGYMFLGGEIYRQWNAPGGAWDYPGHNAWVGSYYMWISMGPWKQFCTTLSGSFDCYDPTNGTVSWGDIFYIGGPKTHGDSFQ